MTFTEKAFIVISTCPTLGESLILHKLTITMFLVSTLLSEFLLMNKMVNMQGSIFYSSVALFAMCCLALAISIFLRLESHAINSLPKDLSANIFNKTFIVFNPYQEHRRIHGHLSLFLLLVGFAFAGFALIVWKMIECGLLLSLFILIIGLNLIVLEDVFEVYRYSKIFIKAVQGRTNLGVGDLKVFQLIKKVMPKLSNYYFGLSIVFMVFSAMLPYIWSSALWFFAQFIGLILQVSAPTGVISWQVAVFLFVLVLVAIQIFASAVKNKLLSHMMEF